MTHGPENNRRHHEREVGNLKLAMEKALPVVRFISANPDKGEIVTEFFDGETLKTLLLNSTGLDYSADLIRTALETLGRLHDLGGMIHFDPHCGNFLVNSRFDMLICDLGLSFSKSYPHLVPPPTSESDEHFSPQTNRAIQKSYSDGDGLAALNQIGVKEDLFVFAADVIRLLPEQNKSLDPAVYRVLNEMKKGRYSTVSEALRKLPQPTPKPGQLPPKRPPSNQLNLKYKRLPYLFLAFFLAAVLVAGVHGLPRVSSAYKAPSLTTASASVGSTAVSLMATSTLPAPSHVEARKPESPLLPQVPVAPQFKERSADKQEAPTSQSRVASLPVMHDSAPKTPMKPARSRRELHQTELLAAAKEHEQSGNYTTAYSYYIKANDRGVDCTADIARLEKMVEVLLGSKNDATRAAGMRLLRAVADQPGRPKAKYYTALALQTGEFGEKNLQLARHYYQLAEKNGHPEAAKGLRELRDL